MKKIILKFLIISLLYVYPNTASAIIRNQQDEKLTDEQILNEIHTKLATETELQLLNLSITCKDKVVTVTGDIKTFHQYGRVMLLLRHTPGVKEIKKGLRLLF